MSLCNSLGGSDEFFKSYVDLVKEDSITWDKFVSLMDNLTPTLKRAKSLIAILMREFKTSKEAKSKRFVDNSCQYDLAIKEPPRADMDVNVKTEMIDHDDPMDNRPRSDNVQEPSEAMDGTEVQDIKIPITRNILHDASYQSELNLPNIDGREHNIKIESVTSLASVSTGLLGSNSNSSFKTNYGIQNDFGNHESEKIKRKIEVHNNPTAIPFQVQDPNTASVVKDESQSNDENIDNESHQSLTQRNMTLLTNHQANQQQKEKANVYKCSKCERSFDNKVARKRHFSFLHIETKCDTCDKTLENQQKLKKHKLKSHYHRCKRCPESLVPMKTKLALVKHIETFHKVKCLICTKEFNNNQDLSEHYSEELSLANACNFCGKISLKSDFPLPEPHQHLLHCPTMKHSFRRCEQCGRVYDKKSIKKHILAVHSTLKPFSCPVCNRDFALKNYLQRHMKVHAKHQDTYGQISIFLEPRLPLLVDFDNNENI